MEQLSGLVSKSCVLNMNMQDYLDQVQNRTKEKKYTFDVAYDTMVRHAIASKH